jgi:hypothetical protein
MTFRRFAHFDTAIPSGEIDTEEEWRVGGEGVAIAIAEILRSNGHTADQPEYEGDHGWTFYVFTRRRRYYFQVQHGSVVALMSDIIGMFKDKIGLEDHIALLSKLNDALHHDERFSNIRWVSDDELYHEGGTPTPTG